MATCKILSTKKLEPLLKEKAKEAGIELTEKEAIYIRPILTKDKWDEIFSLVQKDIQHAVFTSSNAVSSLKKYFDTYVNYLPVQWKIFCLAGKTKDSLLQHAEIFGSIEGTANDATELAHVILDTRVKEVVFFCGNRRRDNLPVILQGQGVRVHEVVVYETMEASITMDENYHAVLFFSPSAVQSFFSANQLKPDTVCFAIGKTTADSIAAFTNNRIIISELPDQEMLLASVILYFSKQ